MRWTFSRGALLLPLILVAFPGRRLSAQEPGASWRFRPTLSAFVEADDNPFLLSPRQKDRLASPPAGTPASRYANMESASDVIAGTRAELEFRGPGLGGRTLAITPEIAYDRYLSNGERSAAQVGVSVAQNMGRGSRVRVRARLTPATFFKNYLSDALDADANGSIAFAERTYAPGAPAERTFAADYVFRVKRPRKGSRASAFLRVAAGHAAEEYDAPFAVRDRAGPFAALELSVARRRLEVEAQYEFAAMGATPGRAVRLLDEPDFNRDFNGNGTTTDLDARAFEMVDYSRTEQGVSLVGRFPAGRRTTLRAEIAHRRRAFGSAQPYDANNGRTDARNTLGAGATVKLASSLRLVTSVESRTQTANKALDAVGDVADYSRRRITAGLTYAY